MKLQINLDKIELVMVDIRINIITLKQSNSRKICSLFNVERNYNIGFITIKVQPNENVWFKEKEKNTNEIQHKFAHKIQTLLKE